MDLVRDLLDAQLVDKHGRNIGRVDGIVLEIRQGRPPRVAAMEIGAMTLARRLHVERWFRAVVSRISPVPIEPVRLPLETFKDVGVDIELDVDADSDPKLLRLEKWLKRHVISKIPRGTQVSRSIVHVEDLLGRAVTSADGRRVGRIEELVAERHG